MQLDADTLAKLAAYGTNLEAPEGESLEDIQQARRAELTGRIDELNARIKAIREAARQAALEHDRYLSETRQSILDSQAYTDMERRYALRDLNRYTITSREVYDRELRSIPALRRQLQELQSQLDNES